MDEGCEIFKNENKFSMEESNVDEIFKTWQGSQLENDGSLQLILKKNMNLKKISLQTSLWNFVNLGTLLHQ